MQPPQSAAQLATTTFPLAGQMSDPISKVSPSAAVEEGTAARPMLSECPLGCGHPHIEHPHLNMMHE